MPGLQTEGKMNTAEVNQEIGRAVGDPTNSAESIFLELLGKISGAPAVAPVDLYGKNSLPPIIRPFPYRINNVTIPCTFWSNKGGGGEYRWGWSAFNNAANAGYSDSSISYGGVTATSFSGNGSNYRKLNVQTIFGGAGASASKVLTFQIAGFEPDPPDGVHSASLQAYEPALDLLDYLNLDVNNLNFKINFGGTVLDAVYNGQVLSGGLATNDEAAFNSLFGAPAQGKTKSFSFIEIYYV